MNDILILKFIETSWIDLNKEPNSVSEEVKSDNSEEKLKRNLEKESDFSISKKYSDGKYISNFT